VTRPHTHHTNFHPRTSDHEPTLYMKAAAGRPAGESQKIKGAASESGCYYT